MQRWQLRTLRPSDFDRVERLITQMFAELGTSTIPGDWSADWRRHVSGRLGVDAAGFVATSADDVPIAVAIGVIDRRLPSPRRPSGHVGYVEWLFTDPDYRRQGAASNALAGLLAWFDNLGIAVVDVHSSDTAVPIYEGAGFATPKAHPLRRRNPAN